MSEKQGINSPAIDTERTLADLTDLLETSADAWRNGAADVPWLKIIWMAILGFLRERIG
jgi:hypothetical protein